jgi:predicted  nucleic acid-binding Zn-ribbon protein
MLQNLNDSTSQKNEVQNFEEEVVILKSKVKDLEQQLEDTTIETETLEKTQKSKLEQQDKTFEVVYVGVFIVM